MFKCKMLKVVDPILSHIYTKLHSIKKPFFISIYLIFSNVGLLIELFTMKMIIKQLR